MGYSLLSTCLRIQRFAFRRFITQPICVSPPNRTCDDDAVRETLHHPKFGMDAGTVPPLLAG